MPRLQKNLTRLIAISCISFSLVSCAIPRPVGLLCIAHLADPAHGVPVSYNHCYDMETDFDSQGNLIAGHKGKSIPLIIDKHVNLDADSFASLVAYMQKLEQRYANCQAGN